MQIWVVFLLIVVVFFSWPDLVFLNVFGAECPSGWIRHDASCYHFSHDKEQWTDVQNICKTFGGNLADITSRSEDNFLENEVLRLKVNHWVGGNDFMNEGEWKWVSTNDDVYYTNWMPGEPNNNYLNENCMDLGNRHGWNDGECNTLQNYICERSAREGTRLFKK